MEMLTPHTVEVKWVSLLSTHFRLKLSLAGIKPIGQQVPPPLLSAIPRSHVKVLYGVMVESQLLVLVLDLLGQSHEFVSYRHVQCATAS